MNNTTPFNKKEKHPSKLIKTIMLTTGLLLFFSFVVQLHAVNLFDEQLSGKQLLGKPSPDFNLSNLTGSKQSLSQWKGKVILLNFWATWCSPCQKEIPLLNRVQKQFEHDDLQIVGIAIDNTKAVEKFTQRIPMNYPSLLAGSTGTQLVKRFGNMAGALPYTVIIDQQGNIVEIASGLLTEKYLKQVIEKYL